jgi:GNAT superfamily N-acetyltransferase
MKAPGYIFREGFEVMDFGRVHAWLAATYWTPGIPRERVERAARNSALVLGAFTPEGVQVGFMRVVSDKTRFAYLCDVIVDESHRNRGIARAMVEFALGHPEFATVTTWTLATRDAHGVYAPLGFLPVTEPVSRPADWMILRRKPESSAPSSPMPDTAAIHKSLHSS